MTGKTGNFAAAGGLGTVTGGAGGNIGVGNSILEDILARSHEPVRGATDRRGIELLNSSASADTIPGFNACATLNMILLVRRCSIKARS